MSNNNTIITKFDTARTENEGYFKMKFDEFTAELYIAPSTWFFCTQFKSFSFLLWPTFSWYHQIAIYKIAIFALPCITIHQTSIIHNTRRRHPSSNSIMMECHYLCLISIFFSKQEMFAIQITTVTWMKIKVETKVK